MKQRLVGLGLGLAGLVLTPHGGAQIVKSGPVAPPTLGTIPGVAALRLKTPLVPSALSIAPTLIVIPALEAAQLPALPQSPVSRTHAAAVSAERASFMPRLESAGRAIRQTAKSGNSVEASNALSRLFGEESLGGEDVALADPGGADGPEVSQEKAAAAAMALLKSNAAIFVKKDSFEAKIKKIERTAGHPYFPYFTAEIEVEAVGTRTSLPFHFRTDGKLAFLSSSWALFQEGGYKSFRAVRLDPDGTTETFDQTEHVLESLPDKIILSRVMDDKEFALWKEGRIEDIRSTINITMGYAQNAPPRTSFALNYYRFREQVPRLFELSKKSLRELHRRGLLVINTYEDVKTSPSTGLHPGARTPFGLEVEVVVIGLEGRRAILPRMLEPVDPRAPFRPQPAARAQESFLLGAPHMDGPLKKADTSRLSSPYYKNRRGKIRAREYGTPGYSRTLGNKTVSSLSYPYRLGRRIVIDLLVQGIVRTLPISLLMKTDFEAFKKYWIGQVFGVMPVKVPTNRVNRFLVGVPAAAEGGKAAVTVLGRRHEVDLEDLYLANLYLPDNALMTLRRLQEAGGDGYLIRADVDKNDGDSPDNPAQHSGEMVLMTKVPEPSGRDPKAKDSLFLNPRFAAVVKGIEGLGVEVLFGDFPGIHGKYAPANNALTLTLLRRFPELRRAENGVILVSDRMPLSTLLHERRHVLDRIRHLSDFKRELTRQGVWSALNAEQRQTIWIFITEHNAYGTTFRELAYEGKVVTSWGPEPTQYDPGDFKSLNHYRDEVERILRTVPAQVRKEVDAVIRNFTLEPTGAEGLPEFRRPDLSDSASGESVGDGVARESFVPVSAQAKVAMPIVRMSRQFPLPCFTNRLSVHRERDAGANGGSCLGALTLLPIEEPS